MRFYTELKYSKMLWSKRAFYILHIKQFSLYILMKEIFRKFIISFSKQKEKENKKKKDERDSLDSMLGKINEVNNVNRDVD